MRWKAAASAIFTMAMQPPERQMENTSVLLAIHMVVGQDDGWIYCMKESWANYPAQEAYIMPEPIPDEGYAFDYWEESRVPALLENLYKKIENEEQNDNSLSYLIEHPWENWPGGVPGDGIEEWDWSKDFDNWYYSIFRTGITYIAHFKKIDDGDDGSRLIPCPYGVCNEQPTMPYVVEPIVEPIVKPIEKPAPLNLPRTASAQK